MRILKIALLECTNHNIEITRDPFILAEEESGSV